MSDDAIGRLRAALAASAACGCHFPGAHGVRDDDIRATLDALDASQREAERLRGERDQARRAARAELLAEIEAREPATDADVRAWLLLDAVADARRAALEDAIEELEAVECIGLEEGATYGAALLRAMLDAPGPETT